MADEPTVEHGGLTWTREQALNTLDWRKKNYEVTLREYEASTKRNETAKLAVKEIEDVLLLLDKLERDTIKPGDRVKNKKNGELFDVHSIVQFPGKLCIVKRSGYECHIYDAASVKNDWEKV